MPFCPNCGREVQADTLFCPNCGLSLTSSAQQAGTVLPGRMDPDASTAKSLTLAAIILQLVFFVIGIIAVATFFAFAAVASVTSGGTTTSGTFPELQLGYYPNFAFGIFGLVFSVIFLISVLWVALDYFLVYKNLRAPETLPSARTPALLLGILQLIFGGFIPGILLIIAYAKIGDSMRNRGQMF